MEDALNSVPRLGVLLTTFVKNEEAPMKTFNFRSLLKHPMAFTVALATLSYFSLISVALAGKPGPDFFVCFLPKSFGRGGTPPFC